jgi:hypothetical protein
MMESNTPTLQFSITPLRIMSDILNKTIVLVLNRIWQAIHVRTPQEAFCMMATNVATALEIEGEKLPPLLLACADEDKRLAGFAQNALRAWSRNYNSSFSESTRIDFERIQDALRRAEKRIPHGAAAEIRACLNIYFK